MRGERTRTHTHTMGAAETEAAFAMPELRGEIMAQRARGMARDHVRLLRERGGAPGAHRRSVRCARRAYFASTAPSGRSGGAPGT